MSLEIDVYNQLRNNLHSEDFQWMTRGLRKTIVDGVIEQCKKEGIEDVNYVTNRVQDRFGMGFDPSNNFYDLVFYSLKRLCDGDVRLKYISPKKIYDTEKSIINDYKEDGLSKIKAEELARDVAKMMIDRFRYKIRNGMVK